jgi:hypothetical protein
MTVKKEISSMRTKLFIVITGLGSLLATVPVWAHHAFGLGV